MKRQTSKRKWQALPIAVAAAYAVPTASEGDVVVFFSEVDAGGGQTNVVATWTGVLTLQSGSIGIFDGSDTGKNKASTYDQISSVALHGRRTVNGFSGSGRPFYDYSNAGVAETLSSVITVLSPSTAPSELNGLGLGFSFGFNNTSFTWDDGSSRTNATPANLTQTVFDFDAETYTMTFENHDYISLGINGFSRDASNPTLAWTANGTGDTISYVVPEPSALALFGVSSLGLLLRRRR